MRTPIKDRLCDVTFKSGMHGAGADSTIVDCLCPDMNRLASGPFALQGIVGKDSALSSSWLNVVHKNGMGVGIQPANGRGGKEVCVSIYRRCEERL